LGARIEKQQQPLKTSVTLLVQNMGNNLQMAGGLEMSWIPWQESLKIEQRMGLVMKAIKQFMSLIWL
jgi:hypothetical protein